MARWNTSHRRSRLTGICLATVAATLALGGSAAAAVFQVDTTGQGADASPGNGICADAGGGCSIRAAVQEANALGGPDEVRVPPGNYPITQVHLQITSSLRLVGTGGARQTTLTAGAPSVNRILQITGGGTVTVEGLTFTGVTGTGPAVDIDGPDTTLRGVAVRDNATTFTTAGIRVGSGEVAIAQSSVTGNQLTRNGDAFGGGIAVSGAATSVTIVASTVANNGATAVGLGTAAWGGGVGVSAGSAVLRHATLRDNSVAAGSAAAIGGNLYLQGAGNLSDSILTGGTAATGPNCYRSGVPPFTATGRNIYPAAGSDNCPFAAGTVAAATASLSLLGDNGGPGLSSIPMLPSAAFDAASGCPDGGRDQRGALAPAGAACDIGATELGADLQVTLTAPPRPAIPGAPITLVAQVTNAGADVSPATRLTLSTSRPAASVTPSSGSCSGELCSVGPLLAGQSATVVAVLPGTPGTVAATASAGGDVPDPTPADATAAISVTVPDGPSTIPPSITGLGAKGKLRARRGGTLKGRLSSTSPARIRIAVARETPGRRASGRCRAGARKGKRCTVRTALGAVTAERAAGAFTVKLPGRVGRRPLTAGRYRLTAVATDTAGRRSAKPATASVRVHPAARPKRSR